MEGEEGWSCSYNDLRLAGDTNSGFESSQQPFIADGFVEALLLFSILCISPHLSNAMLDNESSKETRKQNNTL